MRWIPLLPYACNAATIASGIAAYGSPPTHARICRHRPKVVALTAGSAIKAQRVLQLFILCFRDSCLRGPKLNLGLLIAHTANLGGPSCSSAKSSPSLLAVI